MHVTRRMLLAGATATAASALAQPARAQQWPTRAVNVAVPYSAGGTTDLFGRIFAQAMQEKYGKPFVVENRAGAGGTVGAAFAAEPRPMMARRCSSAR